MSEPVLNRNGWERSIKGWNIVDVAIRQQDVVCLLLRERIDYEKASMMFDHQIRSRLVSISLSRPRNTIQQSHQGLMDFNMPVLGVSRIDNHQPLGLVAAKNLDGDVWKTGKNLSGPMGQIAKGQSPFTNRLKCINGIYICRMQ